MDSYRNRYAAMKRFFKYGRMPITGVMKPKAGVMVDGIEYTCFLSRDCFVFTKESTGEIERMSNADGKAFWDFPDLRIYMDILKNEKFQIDLKKFLEHSKTLGYKRLMKEFSEDYTYLGIFKEYNYSSYREPLREPLFRTCLIEKCFSCIDDGGIPDVYFSNDGRMMLIETGVGIAGICGIIPLKKDVVNVEINNFVVK